MRIRIPLTVVLSATTLLAAEEAFRYSDAPLQQKPLLTATEVATGTDRFYNRIYDRRSVLNEDRKAAQRRQASLLIDSLLTRRRAEGRTEFNASETSALRTLLD